MTSLNPTPSAEEIYGSSAAAGARPDPLLTVSEWADRYRVLSQRASAEPGPWRTDRTPYLREIMDCLSPSSKIEQVVFMKGAVEPDFLSRLNQRRQRVITMTAGKRHGKRIELLLRNFQHRSDQAKKISGVCGGWWVG